MSHYRKAIVATISAIGALVGLLIGLATGNVEVGAAVAAVIVAAGPALVYWVPNAPNPPDNESS